jgi:hypothetical protein
MPVPGEDNTLMTKIIFAAVIAWPVAAIAAQPVIECNVSKQCSPAAADLQVSVDNGRITVSCPLRNNSTALLIERAKMSATPDASVIVNTSSGANHLLCHQRWTP